MKTVNGNVDYTYKDLSGTEKTVSGVASYPEFESVGDLVAFVAKDGQMAPVTAEQVLEKLSSDAAGSTLAFSLGSALLSADKEKLATLLDRANYGFNLKERGKIRAALKSSAEGPATMINKMLDQTIKFHESIKATNPAHVVPSAEVLRAQILATLGLSVTPEVPEPVSA